MNVDFYVINWPRGVAIEYCSLVFTIEHAKRNRMIMILSPLFAVLDFQININTNNIPMPPFRIWLVRIGDLIFNCHRNYEFTDVGDWLFPTYPQYQYPKADCITW